MSARQAVAVREFDHDMFGAIRGAEIDEAPWFVGMDLATALGYKRPSQAIWRHVPSKHKKLMRLDDSTSKSPNGRFDPELGGNPHQMMVDEPGLYRLVLHSRLKAADEFVEWVTADVLPSIRKTGTYTMPQRMMTLLDGRSEDDVEKALVQYDRRVAGNAKRKATNARKAAADVWTDGQILVAIGRRLGRKYGNYAAGMLQLYEVIEQECHVPLQARKQFWMDGNGTSITSGDRKLFTFIYPEEMSVILAILHGWCHSLGININDIIAKRGVRTALRSGADG